MSKQLTFHPVYDLISDLLVIVDYDTRRIVQVNQAMCVATGFTRQDLFDCTLDDLFRWLNDHHLTSLVEAIPRKYHVQLVGADGTHHDATVHLKRYTEYGKPYVACVATFNDDPHTVARKLQEQQMVYHALVSGHFDLLFRIQRDGTYVDFKLPGGLGLYEPVDASEIIGRNVKDVVPDHVHRLVMPVIERVIDTGQAENVDYQIQEKNGLHYYAARFVPSLPGEIVAVVRDVTEQQRTNRLLHHQRDLSIALSSETNLDQALHQVLDTALTIAGLDCGGIYLINHQTQGLELACHQGLSAEFLAVVSQFPADAPQTHIVKQGKTIYADYRQLPVPDHDLGLREGLQAFVSNPIRHKTEVIGCINLASKRYETLPTSVRNALEVIADQAGNAIGRIQTEAQLRENEAVIRTLLNAPSDTALLIDRDGLTLAINEAGAKRFNTTAEAMMGRSIMDFLPPSVAQQRLEVGQQVFHTGQPVQFEDERAGIHFDNTVYPLFDTRGEVYRLAVFARDITQQKHAAMLLYQQRDLGIALSSESNLNQALKRVLETTIEITQMACGGIYLVDNTTGSITLSFHLGISEQFAKTVYYYGPDTSHTQFVMRGEAVYTHYSQLPLDPIRQSEGLRAFAMVPIWHNERVIACIMVASRETDDVPLLTRNTLESIAVQIGSAIARIRAEEAHRKKDQLLEAAARANSLLLATPKFKAVVPLVLEIMGKAAQADRAFLSVTDQRSEAGHSAMNIRAAWPQIFHYSPSLLDLIDEGWPYQHKLFDRLQGGEIISGPINMFPERIHQQLTSIGIRSFVLAPIFSGNEIWGIVALEDHQTEREWGPEERQVLSLMVSSIGTAIDRQRSEETLRQERKIAETLREVGMILTATLNLDDVLVRILEQAKRVVPYDTASVLLIDGEQVRLEVFSGYENVDTPRDVINSIAFELEQATFFQTMLKTHKPYVCSDVEQDANWIFNHDAEWTKSWLGAPIVVREQVVGFFALDSIVPDFYSERHVNLIEPFAQQAAIAFENATLFAEMHELEQVKSKMIRMASHDLRSPLTRIRTALAHIDQTESSAPASEHYQRIWTATHDMERLITNILSLERIEARHYTAQSINWYTLISETLNASQVEIETKQHTLITELSPDLPSTRGDPVQLRQAVANLLDNAVKYTEPGGNITLRAYIKPYGFDQTLAIEVEDTGIGIPYDQQANLFQPFFRAGQTDAKDEAVAGVGLGLSIVKNAIDYHKGKIYFSSIPGEGSLFGFWIPLSFA